MGVARAVVVLSAWLIAAGCTVADPRPRIGEILPGRGLVVAHTDFGESRWAVTMRMSGDEICTDWELFGPPPATGTQLSNCSNRLTAMLQSEPAPPVFVELGGGGGGGEVAFFHGFAGRGLARVVLDYGHGQVAPTLVDLSPISLDSLGFAFALPGRVEIRHMFGFDAEGRQIFSQEPV